MKLVTRALLTLLFFIFQIGCSVHPVKNQDLNQSQARLTPYLLSDLPVQLEKISCDVSREVLSSRFVQLPDRTFQLTTMMKRLGVLPSSRTLTSNPFMSRQVSKINSRMIRNNRDHRSNMVADSIYACRRAKSLIVGFVKSPMDIHMYRSAVNSIDYIDAFYSAAYSNYERAKYLRDSLNPGAEAGLQVVTLVQDAKQAILNSSP